MKRTLTAWVCLLFVAAAGSAQMYTGSIPKLPCTAGTKCTWTTTTIDWKLVEVTIVPDGYTPTTWRHATEVSEELADKIGGDMGEACVAAMQVYLGATAGVIWVRFERTEKTTVREIICEGGTWRVQGDPEPEVKTRSDWVKTCPTAEPASTMSPQSAQQCITDAIKRHEAGRPKGENGTPNHSNTCP